MFRDITINKVAFWLSSITGVILFITLFGFSKFALLNSLMLSLFLFGLTFVINRYFLKKAIFNKINLIYKIVRDAKAKDNVFDENSSFDQVNTEVATWAFNTKQELSKLQSLSDYRKEYVGNISHELKTPIFSIQGYLHTLLEGGLHDENINVNYLQKALNNLERLQYIVEDLDTINHLENNKEAIQLGVFDIRTLVNKVFIELEKVALDANINLHYSDKDEGPIKVKGDERRIHQVMYNLIINSIKYGKDGGNTEVLFHQLDGHYMIEITDNGIGVAEEHLKHLFDRFYRVDQSRSRTLGGSGLGLSIVKHVIESHNQSITVSSKLRTGTSFNFTLERA